MSIIKDFSIKKSNLPNELYYLDLDNLLLLPAVEKTITLTDAKDLNIIDHVLQDPRRLLAIIPAYKGKFVTDIGCASKVVSFVETHDGKYIITICGICRFHIDDVSKSFSGLKKVKPIWYEFLEDLDFHSHHIKERHNLNDAIFNYFNIYQNRDDFDYDRISKITDDKIISILTTNLDYDLPSKEKLIHAKSLDEMSSIFHEIIELKMAQYESKVQIKH